MTRPTLTFLGGTGTVTGSKFLIRASSTRILVDAGLYQGLSELRRRNWAEPPLDPTTLDAVVLTHAHLDHSGYLPRLVRDGFRGPILCTRPTGELAAIVLRDSAHLQEEDAAYANAVGYSKHHPALPLYEDGDVLKTLSLLRPMEYGERRQIGEEIRVTLQPAGHILGSSTALVEVDGVVLARRRRPDRVVALLRRAHPERAPVVGRAAVRFRPPSSPTSPCGSACSGNMPCRGTSVIFNDLTRSATVESSGPSTLG